MSDEAVEQVSNAQLQVPLPPVEKDEEKAQSFKASQNLTKPRHAKPSMAEAKRAESDLSGRSKKGETLEQRAAKKEAPLDAKAIETPDATAKADVTPPALEAKIEEPKIEPPKVEEKRKYKLKVDGEEIEVDEEELKRGYQLEKASYKKFQEAAEIKKKAEAFFSKMKDKTGLTEVLQALGHDPRKLAEEYLADALTFELLSPEQKRIRQLEWENQRFKQTEQEKQILAQQQQLEREEKAHAEAFQKSIIEALPKYDDIPQDSDTVRLVAAHMRKAILAQRHLPDDLQVEITPDMVMDDVRNTIKGAYQRLATKMTPQQLQTYLGKEKLDEIRKFELSQIKNPIASPAQPIKDSSIDRTATKKPYRTMEEFLQSSKTALRRR